jgi:hypothetical protein
MPELELLLGFLLFVETLLVGCPLEFNIALHYIRIGS